MKDDEVTQDMIVASIKAALARYLIAPMTIKQVADKMDPESIIAAAYLTGMAAASGTLATYDGSPVVTPGNFLAAVSEISGDLGFTISRGGLNN